MKRCVIFFFYDKEGIVDRYIYHILLDLKKCSERIIFVCNGKLSSQSRKGVNNYTKDILVRKNEGLDVWAYKEGISYLGWDQATSYDELILMNFTIFPTIYSFCNMFDEMEHITADFWGVTAYFSQLTSFAGEVPDHIQSHFIAVRNPMLSSYEFKKYWENVPSIRSYTDSVVFHESQFKKRFEEYGFKSYIYAEAEELRPLTNCPSYWRQKYLLQNTKTPLIKRKMFYYSLYDGWIHECMGEAAADSYDWLKNSGEYDTAPIWENILRTNSMPDIKRALQLNYIFSYTETLSAVPVSAKIAVLFFVYSCDFVKGFKEYLDSIPEEADIYILSPLEDIHEFKELFSERHQIFIHKTEPGQLASTATLHFLKNNDLPCEYLLVFQIGVSERTDYAATYKSMECLLKSPPFIQNILQKFEEEPYLGLMFPSPPNTVKHTSVLGREWNSFQNEAIEIADDLGIPIDKNQPPITPYFGTYWCRMKTMRKLLQICPFHSFQKIENLRKGPFEFWNIVIGLLAQKQGYYSAWVYNERIAAMELTNIFFYLEKLLRSAGAQPDEDIWKIASRIKK